MTIVTLRAAGTLPADEAWERYAVPALWPTWAPQIRSVDALGERIVPGLAGRVHGPVGVSVDFVVDEVDEDARTWSWTAHRFPVTLRLRHRIRERATGCTTSLALDGQLPVVLAYAPVARFALHRLVSGQPASGPGNASSLRA